METKKQLFDNIGSNPMDHYGDEHLSAEEAATRRASDNISLRRLRENTKGTVVGHYVWDKENGCLKFVPKRD